MRYRNETTNITGKEIVMLNRTKTIPEKDSIPDTLVTLPLYVFS